MNIKNWRWKYINKILTKFRCQKKSDTIFQCIHSVLRIKMLFIFLLFIFKIRWPDYFLYNCASVLCVRYECYNSKTLCCEWPSLTKHTLIGTVIIKNLRAGAPAGTVGEIKHVLHLLPAPPMLWLLGISLWHSVKWDLSKHHHVSPAAL